MTSRRPGRRFNWRLLVAALVLALIGSFAPVSPGRHQGWRLVGPAPVQAQFGFRTSFDPRRPIAAEVDVDEAGGDARKFLDQIDAFLQDGQWSEAVDAVQKVTGEYGDKVVLVHKTSSGFRHYVSVRDFCQRRLVDPRYAAVLDVYRPRIDPLAKQWYDVGLARRDEKLLQRLVDEAFAGSWTDEALFALGELALSRGDPASARAAWTRIFPPDPNQPAAAAAAYPDSDLKPADVDARLVLASILQGDRARAAEELETSLRGGLGFIQRYPESRGRLAGKEGKYADLLRDLLKQSESWPKPRPSDDWPTFAGDYERNGIAPAAVAVAGKAWKSPIELKQVSVMPAAINREYSLRRVGEQSGRPLAYFPSVVGDKLVIHQQTPSEDNAQMGVDQLLVYNLDTGLPVGQRAVVYTSDKWPLYSPKSLGVPRFTTTIHGNRIYACLGAPTPPEFGDAPEVFRQSIVCVDLTGLSGWTSEHNAGHILPPGWRAEGAPICDGPRLYVLVREITPAKEHSHVLCLDAENGRRLWIRKLGSGDVRARATEGEVEITNSLLTLAHGVLYANTNLGVVAALDAVDGRVKWTTSFARTAQMDLSQPLGYFYRDLNPCLYHEGLVFVAPNDTPAVFALDAATGRVWWSVDLPDVTHLLGAAGDKLIAAGDRLYWLEYDRAHPEAGAKLATWFGDGNPPGYGRGTLVGDVVYWPTEAEIHIFDQRSGVRRGLISLFAEPAFREKTGNLIVAGGKLLVAQPDRIVAFNQFSRKQREDAESITKARPDDASAWFALARCEEALGDLDPAARHYRTALDRAKPADEHEGRPLTQASRQRLTSALSERAKQLADDDLPAAVERLREAAAAAGSPLERLAYRLTAAELLAESANHEGASLAYAEAAADPALAALSVADETARPIAATRYLAGKQAALVPAGNAPAPDAADDALLPKKPSPIPPDPPGEPSLWSVGRAVELACDHATAPRGDPPAGQAAVVMVRLGEQPAPLNQRAPAGDLPNRPTKGAVVMVHRVSDATVRATWPLDSALLFAGWTEDRTALLVVSETDATAVDVAAGRILWRTALADPRLDGAHPFAPPPLAPTTSWGRFRPASPTSRVLRRWDERSPHVAGDWRFGDMGVIEEATLCGSQLFLRQGEAQVLALDAATGEVRWIYPSPAGPLARRLAATTEHVVVQLNRGREAIVLSAATGVETGHFNLASLDPAPLGWVSAPAALDAHRLVVAVSPSRLALLDLQAGRLVWVRPSLGEPDAPVAPFVAGEALLAVLNGYGVTRLDPATGDPVWPASVRLALHPSPGLPDRLTSDGQTLYVVANGDFQALRLEDGRPRYLSDERIGGTDEWFEVRMLPGALALFPKDMLSDHAALTIISQADGSIVQRLPFNSPPNPYAGVNNNSARSEMLGRSGVVASLGLLWSLQPR